jgi:hypothetical protein
MDSRDGCGAEINGNPVGGSVGQGGGKSLPSGHARFLAYSAARDHAWEDEKHIPDDKRG